MLVKLSHIQKDDSLVPLAPYAAGCFLASILLTISGIADTHPQALALASQLVQVAWWILQIQGAMLAYTFGGYAQTQSIIRVWFLAVQLFDFQRRSLRYVATAQGGTDSGTLNFFAGLVTATTAALNRAMTHKSVLSNRMLGKSLDVVSGTVAAAVDQYAKTLDAYRGISPQTSTLSSLTTPSAAATLISEQQQQHQQQQPESVLSTLVSSAISSLQQHLDQSSSPSSCLAFGTLPSSSYPADQFCLQQQQQQQPQLQPLQTIGGRVAEDHHQHQDSGNGFAEWERRLLFEVFAGFVVCLSMLLVWSWIRLIQNKNFCTRLTLALKQVKGCRDSVEKTLSRWCSKVDK